ncbi:MAG TPA: sulfite exporter TauE/SafE family protein [Acetobacteraceae bacterium]|nr:sulfite exporter TauE/SafE family protein [Acetobacteraceae bacterium]
MEQSLFAVGSGGVVGFSLGLIGGGGSILAMPLLLYLVALPNVHLAIGTGAVAVALNAFANLIPHARAGHVRWANAAVFATLGVLGAFAGSTIGKAMNGRHLLFLFAVLMLGVAWLMLRQRRVMVTECPRLSPALAARLGAVGLGAGGLAGFFGIGGGFLIVPGLVFGGGMPTIDAIGSSLLAVGLFATTTATNYAVSGLVDWSIAAEVIAGGIAGGWIGARLAGVLSRQRSALNRVFAGVLVLVAAYILYRSIGRVSL